ncbi:MULTISPECIES: MgtC/SapB family protein [Amycolatopsis]|uniref:Mg2+ transporter-C (MgtC) family protein n=1 Tax=Amycolatopsis echigonensis TaxID=2576905 RepID=A0A2N3WNL2_9PSEU|nr:MULTISPECIES: MgtC/SapB family protein [Amycolatopsis]PKV95459.1 putative Mg2+ transporter-C (MgtC) family protein [Amycolatopsis niigatensis]
MGPLWSTGQQWSLLAPVLVALVLSTLIGLERELSMKSAGLRTHALVGVGSAVFMLVSKYGFDDFLANPHVSLDPSRVAAQVVSGVGFLGGGLIFIRSNAVQGLTTAATVWVTAAIGMACGAGLPVLAAAGTAGFFLATRGLSRLAIFAARHRREPPILQLGYDDGQGVLRAALAACTSRGWTVREIVVEPETVHDDGRKATAVALRLDGRGDLFELTAELSEIPGVRSAVAGRARRIEG